jgi:hypothetical protein
MKILREYPPIYEDIINYGMHPRQGTIFTHGDTIYNPDGIEIPEYLMVHEEVHSKQQGEDPNGWWGRYLIDEYFRIEQETESYAKQYDFMCKKVKDRNQRNRLLIDIAKIVSSPTYGNVITTSAAMIQIKNKSKIK